MSAAAHLLIVEDETDLRNMLEYSLAEDGYQMTCVGNGASAWQSLSTSPPDLVLLDWMLPDISGVEILRRMRRTKALQNIPVIMLTAKGEEQDRVEGLDSGADDYMVKPFSTLELQARIRRRLNKNQSDVAEIVRIENLTLDEGSHRISCDGQTISLGPTEYKMLAFFMRHSERVYSRDQLLDSIWGSESYIDDRTIDVHIRRLRKSLQPFGKSHLVQTVRGVGYRFSSQE